MGFSSISFLFIFMPAAVLLYWIINKFFASKASNIALLVFSYVFLAWLNIDAMWLFLLLSLIVYLLGNVVYYQLRQPESRGSLKIWMICIQVCILGYLLVAKYLGFVVSAISELSGGGLSLPKILVPVGVSFFVFGAVSYVVDIYKGFAKPGNIIDALLYFSFFPKVVSGPIVLWRDFESQISSRNTTSSIVSEGVDRIIVGLAKKVIIADSLGAQIAIIDAQAGGSGIDCPTFWLKSVMYFFQIYFDFSGYSDIAIGLSQIFGFNIKENFKFPYLSTSVSEFWRRWHISLGSWFREYLYIPMGGSRTGNVYFNLFVVFVLTGIWHGANFTFWIWGIYNGVFVMLERLVHNRTWYIKTPSLVKWMFTIFVVFWGWVIFSSDSVADFGNVTRSMLRGSDSGAVTFSWHYYLSQKNIILLAVAALGSVIGVFGLSDRILASFSSNVWLVTLRKIALLILLYITVVFAVSSSYSPFLYFQF